MTTKKMETKKKQKREAIVMAAINNFAKKGFYETKVSDIAKEADIADGTVYLYFQNKDDLFIKVFEEMVLSHLNTIKEEVEKETNALKKLYKLFEMHIELFTSNPSFVKFFVQEMRQSPIFYSKYPDFKPLLHYLDYLESLIKEAIEQKLIRPVNVKIATSVMFGSIDFILTEWALSNGKFDIHSIHTEVIDMLHNGFKGEKEYE